MAPWKWFAVERHRVPDARFGRVHQGPRLTRAGKTGQCRRNVDGGTGYEMAKTLSVLRSRIAEPRAVGLLGRQCRPGPLRDQRTRKKRDVLCAVRQLRQALSNEGWLVE